MAPARNAGMICAWTRLAKSAAWMRLKDMGVSSSSILPFLVVRRTMGDEFHSVNTVTRFRLVSHFPSRSICVLLPEPSMPSTIISLPGYFPSSGCSP